MVTNGTQPAPRTPRPGMSMAEVLVALFIMALGTIAILTMFPLGMFQMGQALKDDRTAQSAAQADAYLRWYWRQTVVPNMNTPNAELFAAAMGDPNNSVPLPFQRNPGLPNIDSPPAVEPSYPVFVDPMGFVAGWGTLNTPAHQYWVGGTFSSPNFFTPPRRSTNQIVAQSSLPGNNNYPLRICSLMDGFGYTTDGTPNTVGGTTIERELRYNWLWVVQRPDNTNRTTANLTVVVFDRRAFQFAPSRAEDPFAGVNPPPPATTSAVTFNPGQTVIQIPYTAGINPSPNVPQVQKNGWVLDATIIPNTTVRHAIFYRVVSVTDNPSNPAGPTTDIELQTPIRRIDGSFAPYQGTLVVVSGVSEVFERPPLTGSDF